MDTSKMIFVFGSNTGGIHGAGAARFAQLHRGARFTYGYGHHGQSFAIPTKGAKNGQIRETLPLKQIKEYVDRFIHYAEQNPELQFQVTCIGCGLAGLRHEDVAPMFVKGRGHFDAHVPENCWFDTLWSPYLSLDAKFWGTF